MAKKTEQPNIAIELFQQLRNTEGIISHLHDREAVMKGEIILLTGKLQTALYQIERAVAQLENLDAAEAVRTQLAAFLKQNRRIN